MSPATQIAFSPWRGAAGWLRPDPRLVAIPAAAFLALASALMLLRVPPFINWFYISAWYPTLVLFDASIAARSGRYFLLTRPRFAISLLGWSAVLWFFFELVNFRVTNWYYVFLPPARGLRWLGTTLAFMTVLPAIFLAERWLDSRRLFTGLQSPSFQVGRRLLGAVVCGGVAFAALALTWPALFFPLIWGALTLLLEPWNYRRDPGRSLIGDLAAGRPGRTLRLLVGGMAIGLLWELYNIESRSKWIYTVPGFENFKLFEMPLLGFFGFPIFALDCFVFYQSVVLARVAVAPERGAESGGLRLSARRAAVAGVIGLVFSLGVLYGMDRWNTDSLQPRLADLWLVEASARRRLERTPYDGVFQLADATPGAVAAAVGVSEDEARQWVEAARLAALRGIGTENAHLLWRAGVRSVERLAAVDAGELASRLEALATRPRAASPPRVRVWVRAARDAVAHANP
jgi:predicted flap endonuclease-1-like 5' DNA nuclease